MAAKPAPPRHPNQRRHKALRAYFTEGLTVAQAGCTRFSMASLLRDFRAGRLELFAPPGKPGPRTTPAKDRARSQVAELRRQGLSVHEISSGLRGEGTPLNRTGVGQILAEEGFSRLLLAAPDLVSLDLPALITAAGYPGSMVIPAVSWRWPWPPSWSSCFGLAAGRPPR